MKIEVTRGFPFGYTFVVKKEQYESVDDVTRACLQLEADLLIKEEEEDFEEEE